MSKLLTNEQKGFIDWWKHSGRRVNVLRGFAGTGKTFTMKYFQKSCCMDLKTMWCAPTHMAKAVLEKSVGSGCGTVTTIQSALGLGLREMGRFYPKYRNKVNHQEIELLIIDEASMVDSKMLGWILDTKAKHILFVGDPKQIPPVGESFSPVFASNFAEYTLNTVHRTENEKIIKFCTDIREGDWRPDGFEILTSTDKMLEYFHRYEMNVTVLCGTNAVRDSVNSLVRTEINGGVTPHKFVVDGEVLILDTPVLPPNGLANGDKVVVSGDPVSSRFMDIGVLSVKVNELDDKFYICDGDDESELFRKRLKNLENEYKKNDDNYNVQRLIQNEYDEFTRNICRASHGYALTYHKSQGQTIDNVVMCINDTSCFKRSGIAQNIIYTGASRAKKSIALLI